MNGRLENDLRIYRKIEVSLKDYPRFIIDWYFFLKANKRTAATCRDYMTKIINFLSFINEDIKSVTPEDITDQIVIQYFIKTQTKVIVKDGKEITEYTSDSYQQCIWSCLNSLFTYLENENKIERNFIEKLKIQRPKNKDLARINRHRILLTEEDFKAIMKSVENGAGSNKAKGYQKRYINRDKCMLNIFMTTGVRKSALASINLEDIDFDKKILMVIDKGSIIHEYNLSDTTIQLIKAWLRDRNEIMEELHCDALFVSKELQRISVKSIDKIVKKYSSDALGYSISPHKLRAGFISIIQSKTHDIEFTRRVAGHANVSTTQRYIVTDNTERKQASAMMENLLGEE